ncbi:PhnB protein [Friedmanniella endophytica]|uniref:PhnB protein n=1 Tax=Microlunatus kandeliicorticis TaxID=1759536 RepID=A0A7W3IS56_9ACTN|nr:VOC family protein [Microlunatus kandeliicorticis]MBA8794259.1 PhnB protein [Microlunatus kandeliicorticis]
MTNNLSPYLNFRDSARAALEFYATVFGGEPTFTAFGEFGAGEEMGVGAHEADKIMHGQLIAPNGYVLMAADVPDRMPLTEGGSISVSLFGDDVDELTGYWEKLVDQGQVTVPLEQAPWGDRFGMCVDRFGISWLVNISGSPDAG